MIKVLILQSPKIRNTVELNHVHTIIMAETRRRTPNKKQNDSVAQMSEYGHLQPQALEFEVAVLGACLIEKDAFGLVSDILKPESFYDNKH